MAYVQQLRQENAEARIKAKRSDELLTRLVRALADSDKAMVDVTDLPLTPDVLPGLLDADGYPDPVLVHQFVARTLASKPHLARPVWAADVGQGVQQVSDVGPGLGAMLRAAAG